MSKIFVRERSKIGKGARRPRFVVVALDGVEIEVLVPHFRKSELEAVASATGVEVIYLPRGEKAGENEAEQVKKKRQRKDKQKPEA